jgi:hypothetical protein
MVIPSPSEQLGCRLERNVTRIKVHSEIPFLIVIHCNYCYGVLDGATERSTCDALRYY